MDPRLYILSGASGSGKTTLLNSLAPVDGSVGPPPICPVRAPKYSERPVRNKPGEVDDIIHEPRITAGEFDITYAINNTIYGLRLNEIERFLDSGCNVFIVLSDFRVVRRVKAVLGDRARAIYVASAIDAARLRRIQQERHGFRPDETQKGILTYHFHRVIAAARLGWWDRVSECVAELDTDWRAYATDAASTEIRAQRIRSFHIRYIDSLDLFDHVILNYTEERPEEMTAQAMSILRGADTDRNRVGQRPPIYVLAGASASGKGTLLELLKSIGGDQVRVVSKLAKRRARPGDRDDGMIPIAKLEGSQPLHGWPDWWSPEMTDIAMGGEFPPQYDLRWQFHNEISYAVSSTEIQRNINEGYPQVFVSNMQQFHTFRDRWPQHAVMVYLHRLSSADEDREYQVTKWRDEPTVAEFRIRERETVHRDYIARISEFHHVLLNTSFKEDLYDQMFRLIDHYM